MPSASQPRKAQDPESIRARLEDFLQAAAQPAVLEDGEAPIPIARDGYALQARPPGCVLEVWGASGGFVRRIAEIVADRPDRLDLRVRRFGGADSRIMLVDLARASNGVSQRASRGAFGKFLKRILAREFPDWSAIGVSSAADLHRSLSPLFTRGVLQRGPHAWAVIAVAEDAGAAAADQILTFGLIWLDLVRSRPSRHVCSGLKIFVPRGREALTAQRIAWLDSRMLQYELYAYDPRGEIAAVETNGAGNLSTQLSPCIPPPKPEGRAEEWLRRFLALVEVETVARTDGLWSLRVRGVEFARVGRSVMTFGLDEQKPLSESALPEALQLARELIRLRSPDAADRSAPLYRLRPESWLESKVRRNPAAVMPSALPEPIYSSTPAVAGVSRGIIDLLGCERSGRLVIAELKASEDIHLPLQALDYWARVKWHLDQGEFYSGGYFPGLAPAADLPRLLLVAPALKFHPTTETILRYWRPEIPVERVGLASDWRRRLQADFRIAGPRRLD